MVLHSRPGLAQGHFWCSGFAGEANFLVHLVILLVVLLDQDVLSEPLPCDAVDLPLLKLCLSSQPPFLKTARLGLPLR